MSINKNSIIFLPLLKIFYAYLDKYDSDVESVVENGDKTISVNFFAGRDWKELYNTTGSADFEESESEKDEGILYTQTISINFPGDSNENRTKFEELRNKPLLLRLVFTEGYEKLLGNLENPVFLTKKQKSSNFVNTYEIKFKHNSVEPLPFLV